MIPSSLYCSTCGAANAADSLVCFACKQPLSVVTSDNTPLLQGRYRILTQVGKGGFGAVYRAEDTQKQNAIVAIKQINLRGLTPQETIEATDAFNREVSLLTNLDSSHLPHIHDNFTDPEHWYLVMDFIEGETLEAYLEAKDAHYTMPLNEVLALGVQLCTVLDYLHTREPAIIFRDLKPANIMRTHANKLYLIDFGIARRYNPAKLKDTIPFGSPGYAAPEQYGKAQTTARADIYSLGALLHMLLTGDDPVDNPFHFSPLRMYGASGLQDLEKLLMRMVELKAENRPASVNEVKAELQRIENLQNGGRVWQPPIGQTPDPFSGMHSNGGSQQQLYLSGKGQQLLYMPPAQRNRLARRKFIVGSLSVVGLMAIGAEAVSHIAPLFQYRGGVVGAGGAGAQPTLFANTYTYNGHSASVQCVAAHPTNGYIASASNDGTVQVWFPSQVMQNVPRKVQLYTSYNVGEPVSTLAWGHFNGSDLLAFSKGTSVYVWDLKNTVFSFQASSEPKVGNVQVPINSLAWSPDSQHIAFPTSLGLQLYNMNTRKVDRHFNITSSSSFVPLTDIVSIAWSPASTQIAASRQNENILVWDVASGTMNRSMTFKDGSIIACSPNGFWLATVNGNSVIVSSTTNPQQLWTYLDTDSNSGGVTALAWSPDSRYIVVGKSSDDANNIVVWSPFESGSSSSNVLATPSVDTSGAFAHRLMTNGQAIQSLTWWLNDDGYIVVGADKAYILELRADMLNH